MEVDVWDWLDGLKTFGMQPHLWTTSTLLTRLGLPQQTFPAIHVAGSNGKGTCCAILSNAFSLSGTRCGLFTSPHLMKVNERVRIDGEPITDELFADCLQRIHDASMEAPVQEPTYFEVTFLVAMLAFEVHEVERAVVETGLGGRWDATRLIEADCCVLTEIALEHTEVLGDTLAEIATEKAAIVRQGRPFIATWSYDKGARTAIESAVRDHDMAWWWRADRRKGIKFSNATKAFRPLSKKEDFDGWMPYQQEAAMLARNALWVMGEKLAYQEVDRAVTHTNWPGRMQWIDLDRIPLLLEAAHNPSGMARACEQIRFQKSRDMAPMPGVIMLGCTTQNDLGIFLQPLVELMVEGNIEHVFITEPSNGRKPAVDCQTLAAALTEQGVKAQIECDPDVHATWHAAQKKAFELDEETPVPVLCIGSLYLVGEMLNVINILDEYDFSNILIPPDGEDGLDPIP
jgi:dihydrofolate synthase/folylpolyglutamate synthase